MKYLIRFNGKQNYERVYSLSDWLDAIKAGSIGYQSGNFKNKYMYKDGKYIRIEKDGTRSIIDRDVYDVFDFLLDTLPSYEYSAFIVMPERVYLGGE